MCQLWTRLQTGQAELSSSSAAGRRPLPGARLWHRPSGPEDLPVATFPQQRQPGGAAQSRLLPGQDPTWGGRRRGATQLPPTNRCNFPVAFPPFPGIVNNPSLHFCLPTAPLGVRAGHYRQQQPLSALPLAWPGQRRCPGEGKRLCQGREKKKRRNERGLRARALRPREERGLAEGKAGGGGTEGAAAAITAARECPRPAGRQALGAARRPRPGGRGLSPSPRAPLPPSTPRGGCGGAGAAQQPGARSRWRGHEPGGRPGPGAAPADAGAATVRGAAAG